MNHIKQNKRIVSLVQNASKLADKIQEQSAMFWDVGSGYRDGYGDAIDKLDATQLLEINTLADIVGYDVAYHLFDLFDTNGKKAVFEYLEAAQ